MTMTPGNLTHGQWSKWLFCGQTSRLDQRFTNLTIENLYFVHGHGQNWRFLLNFVVKFKVDHFDHGKFGFWPWSWSKF